MPTFNSNEYLSLPQQVSKNKKDIASLDTRVTNVEADVAENMSVPIIGSCEVLAFDSYISLDIPAQSALGQIVIANHANYQRERLFGLTIQMDPSLVDDSAQFPITNGDVMYNAVFVMGARQLVNIATDEYHYVAISSSVDKRFQIEWNFKHSDNTFTTAPDLIVKNLKPELLQVLSMTYDPIPSRFDFEWNKSYGENLDFEFEVINFTTGIRLCQGEASIKYNSNTPTGWVVGTSSDKLSMKLGKAKDTGTTYATPFGLGTTPWTGTKVIIKVHAKDNRPLAQTTISDYYMYETSIYIRGLNFPVADETILGGTPAEASNIADKRRVAFYLEQETSTTVAPTVTVDGVAPRPSNPAQVSYVKMLFPPYLLSNSGWPKLWHFTYNQASCENSVTVNVGTNIVFTFPSNAAAEVCGSSLSYPYLMSVKFRTASPNVYELGTVKVTRSIAVVTFTVISLTNTVTSAVGGSFDMSTTFMGY